MRETSANRPRSLPLISIRPEQDTAGVSRATCTVFNLFQLPEQVVIVTGGHRGMASKSRLHTQEPARSRIASTPHSNQMKIGSKPRNPSIH